MCLGKVMENVASQDLKAALLESAQIEARKKQAWQEQVDLLSQSLASFEQGAQLDCSTPADGHCLFHALAQGGLVEGIPGSLTVEQLRALAISSATPEQLQHAALSTAGTAGAGMTVDEYVKGMLGGLYGDNLVVAVLAVEFQRNIVVINKDSARSFLLAGGEQQGLGRLRMRLRSLLGDDALQHPDWLENAEPIIFRGLPRPILERKVRVTQKTSIPAPELGARERKEAYGGWARKRKPKGCASSSVGPASKKAKQVK